MKRLLCLTCAFCLLPAAAAPGAIRTFSGVAGATGTVSFDAEVVIKKGKCIKRNRRGRCIRRKRRTVVTTVYPGIRFGQLPMTCDDGAHTITITRFFDFPVVNCRFSHTGGGSSGGTVSLTGLFAFNGRSATGTIRDLGNIASLTNCDTGVLTWSATS